MAGLADSGSEHHWLRFNLNREIDGIIALVSLQIMTLVPHKFSAHPDSEDSWTELQQLDRIRSRAAR